MRETIFIPLELWADAAKVVESGPTAVRNLAYLAASIMFILGLKGLSHPRTAVRANLIGALGMLVAVVVTLVMGEIVGLPTVLAGIVVGSVLGLLLAVKTPMTAMPQMVGLLNGLGGGASVLVAACALIDPRVPTDTIDALVATAASGLIGAVTFWGSLVAVLKLSEAAFTKPIRLPMQNPLNAGLLVVCLVLTAVLALAPLPPLGQLAVYAVISLIASVLGFTLTMNIGGADMPVVIALLNSYSGLAAAATGFVLGNSVLIVSGSLVGASGIILSQIMCKAMNRSLSNVLFGVMGAGTTAPKADDVYGGKVKSASPDDVAMLFDGARRVVIVPGYGMAVAQAQHAVRDLYRLLDGKGVSVEFAIHPVAGRMPGHMNVLLAEADIPYDRMIEMDAINPSFPDTDVVLVIGANDVVNPLARTDPNSPIAGMPILDVDKARTVVVLKRSLSPGFAGIPNPLFAADNCLMLYADGKQGVLDVVSAIKQAA